jgi:CheY-like chemotaxis protein
MIEPRPQRILLVDDDSNLLVVLSEQLRDDGFEVATARDGQEALRRLEAGWPDLIILDLMMPRIDGLALARQLVRLRWGRRRACLDAGAGRVRRPIREPITGPESHAEIPSRPSWK